MGVEDGSRGALFDVALGFGGNLGDPAATILTALDDLAWRGVRVVARSGLYRTPAWGPVAQPDFVNLCALAETALGPHDLVALTQAIEAEHGRLKGERYGPRPLDIDILDVAGLALDDPGLTLPHPRLTERAFVLVPLAEIAPDRVVAGRRVRDWMAALNPSGILRLGTPAPSRR